MQFSFLLGFILNFHHQYSYFFIDLITDLKGSPIKGRSVPTQHDYDGAADGLIRLQRVYEIPTKDLINGQVMP